MEVIVCMLRFSTLGLEVGVDDMARCCVFFNFSAVWST
jgi:hypothetical protein